MKNDRIAQCEQRLAYVFVNKELLTQALTHRSYSKNHNETLEFIGDAALGLVIAVSLRSRFPSACEGELSRLRAMLVKGETLAEIAREQGVGDYLLMGDGELASGGRERTSILADAVEALIGAVHIDGGFEAAKMLVLAWYSQRIEKIQLNHSKDAKTSLQEYLQAQQLSLPVYAVTKTEGEQHQQLFFVRCDAAGKQSVGNGASRRKAEQDAAQNMLKVLDI